MKYIDIINNQYFSLLIATNVSSIVLVTVNSYSNTHIHKVYDDGGPNYGVQALESQNKVTVTLPVAYNQGFAIFSGAYSSVALRYA